MVPSNAMKWHPLELFDRRFGANVAALAARNPGLAERLSTMKPDAALFVAAEGDTVFLGRPGPAGIEPIPNALPPAAALKLASALFPKDQVSWPLVIGGLAYGWLWDRVFKLPCRDDATPGYRPPLYLLTGDLERLWAVLHVLDWRQMLADSRVFLFCGDDPAAQLREALIADPTLPRPKACVRIEQHLWREDFDAMLKTVSDATDNRVAELAARAAIELAPCAASGWAQRLRTGRLRVLGITSRYTTFLQHSMRDWLAGFERLGHETRLLMEQDDHRMLGMFGFMQGILEFRPDLIAIIDHYRAELGDIPQSVPCVMWVQDRLPHIFSDAAGAAQGPRDYCLGFGRLHLSSRFGYPAERFMPSTIGINDQQYARVSLTAEDQDKYGCDVCYVSHASATSDAIIKAELANLRQPQAARLLWDLHDKMVAHFEGGGQVLTEPVLRERVAESMRDARVELSLECITSVVGLFAQQVNNAIFRQQALRWVANLGVDLRIYGRGWERHPELSGFACGEADNRADLPRIYRASKVNLQLTPHGAVHQRLLDGLAAGGFFLMRYTPGDVMGMPYRRLWAWCQKHGVTSNDQLRAGADAEAVRLIRHIDGLLGYDALAHDLTLYDCLATIADEDFMALADSVWPEHYSRVAFGDAADLRDKLSTYLSNDDLRREVADAMRAVVVERCSYASINRRLLRFIADDIARDSATDVMARAA